MRYLGRDADRTEIWMYLRGKTELSVLIITNVVAIISRVLNKYLNDLFFILIFCIELYIASAIAAGRL